jgi:hypothetical protein
MTDARAIAATTMALQRLLHLRMPERDPDIADLRVTTAAPDQARRSLTGAQLNLFLYQTLPNAGWSNLSPLAQVRPGEPGFPPLALNLHYLLTAFGRGEGDTDAVSHRVLGAAMAVLHDQPLLGAEAVREALSTTVPLPPFIERLRITPLPLNIEEISKLWTAFQTQYRLSCAYEVTVVLIESTRERRTAPPVLRRGEGDTGPVAFAEPVPILTGLRYPDDGAAVRPGETLALLGPNLASGAPEAVVTRHGEPAETVLATTQGAEPGSLAVVLDPAAAAWRAGVWTVAARRRHPDGTAWVSNAVPFSIAPTIHGLAPTLDASSLRLQLLVTPPVAEGQKISILVARQAAEPQSAASGTVPQPAPAPPLPATRLTFRLDRPRPGRHSVRLRVDGVDSVSFRRDPSTGALEFDPAQTVAVP